MPTADPRGVYDMFQGDVLLTSIQILSIYPHGGSSQPSDLYAFVSTF